jgi:succinate-semialdehyde dehydrogenase / glutarate-semialdehyde dehydrogenase
VAVVGHPAPVIAEAGVPELTGEDVDRVVDRARQAQANWSALTVRERARHLRAVRRSLVDHGEALVEAIVAETGKPAVDAWYEVLAACAFLAYAARHAPAALRPRRVSSWPIVLKRATVRYQPYGVVAAITPWNYPVAIASQIVVFALAAGNTVVFKPSELIPRIGEQYAKAINAAGRELVFLARGGPATGAALAGSAVDKIAFTGGRAAARAVLARAADRCTPTVLELGGKDAMVVLDGADPVRAARAAAGSAFGNAGQTCIALKRVFVVADRYERFLDELVAVTARLKQGSEPDAHLGPVTRPDAVPVLEKFVRDAVAKGARVLTGGPTGSRWFPPTVLADVDERMAVLHEETFGPILAVMPVADADEAIRLAGSTPFGLNASVFASRRTARRYASKLRVGGVHLGDAMVGCGIPALPFGGVRGSGYGRLQGIEGLREFSTTVSVVTDRVPGTPSLAALLFTRARPRPATLARAARLLYGRRRG